MPSSRHVGHRVGVRVCVVYEAAYYVARVYSPARKQAQSVTTCPRASARSLALASRGNVPLAGGWRVRATRGMIERDVGRRDLGVHISADTFALKRTLISGGRIRIQPPRMCLHVPRGEGDGGVGDGRVRGGKGTAGWSQCAVCIPLGRKDSFVTPYSSTHSPKLVLVADVRVVVGFLSLALYS